MKKLSLIAIILIAGFSSKAQVSVGLKLATNFANIIQVSGSGEKVNTSSRTAFSFGGFAKISLSEKIKLQPEFLYQGMGGKISDITFKNDYVSVPILIQYAVTNNFSLEAGPQIGLLVSSKVSGEDVKDAFKSSDIQLLIGASLGLTDKLGAGVRYGMGISNITTDSYSSVKTDLKNRAFSIMVSYKLF